MKLGEDIRNVLTERDITVKQFAETIGVKRPNAYRIFNQNSIDTALLMKISLCLEYDFFVTCRMNIVVSKKIHVSRTIRKKIICLFIILDICENV